MKKNGCNSLLAAIVFFVIVCTTIACKKNQSTLESPEFSKVIKEIALGSDRVSSFGKDRFIWAGLLAHAKRCNCPELKESYVENLHLENDTLYYGIASNPEPIVVSEVKDHIEYFMVVGFSTVERFSQRSYYADIVYYIKTRAGLTRIEPRTADVEHALGYNNWVKASPNPDLRNKVREFFFTKWMSTTPLNH